MLSTLPLKKKLRSNPKFQLLPTRPIKNNFPTIYTYPHTPTAILYHSPCPDGFCAAFVSWKALGNKIKYFPCSHGLQPPDVRGLHVLVFDMTWPGAVLRRVKKQAKSFILFDHHISGMKEFSKEPGCYFDLNKSGATLAWDFFFPDKEPPRLIQYIEDRDLWKWSLPNSKAFSISFNMTEKAFDIWDQYLDDDAVDNQITKGTLLLEYQDNMVKYLTSKAVQVRWLGYRVYAVNCNILVSEVGNMLAMLPDCDFSAMYGYDGKQGGWNISLRSWGKKAVDCSVVAKKYGGGGHAMAAGMYWKEKDIESLWKSTGAYNKKSVVRQILQKMMELKIMVVMVVVVGVLYGLFFW